MIAADRPGSRLAQMHSRHMKEAIFSKKSDVGVCEGIQFADVYVARIEVNSQTIRT